MTDRMSLSASIRGTPESRSGSVRTSRRKAVKPFFELCNDAEDSGWAVAASLLEIVKNC